MTGYKRTERLTALLTALLVLTAIPAAARSMKEPVSLRGGICLNRSRALFAQGEIREAISVIEAFACPLSPEDKGCAHPSLYFTLGNYYAALARDAGYEPGREPGKKQNRAAGPGPFLARALESYRTALEADPGFCEAWLNLAAVAHRMGRFTEAATAFEKGYATEAVPKAIHLYYAAVCHFQAENPQKALELFTTLLDLHPDQVTPQWREVLVHILFALDFRRRALPHIEALARPWPESKERPDAQAGRQKKWQEILVHQYLSLDMDAKALAYARALTRSDPLEPKWWKALSHVHLKAGHRGRHREEALSSLIIYGFLAPMTPDEELLAADLFFSLNIPARAADRYERLLSILSGEEARKKALKKLIQARAMAHDRTAALHWIDAALNRPDQSWPDLSPKETRNIETLKQQLLQINDFYAAAGPVLSEAPPVPGKE